MYRSFVILLLSIVLLDPAAAQEPPPDPVPPVSEAPSIEAKPNLLARAKPELEAMRAWLQTLEGQEFPVRLTSKSEPFEARLIVRNAHLRGDINGNFHRIVAQYDIALHWPRDVTLLPDHQEHRLDRIGWQQKTVAGYTASFRFPNEIRTYTFRFDNVESDEFTFAKDAYRDPKPAADLRPHTERPCGEQHFAFSPPFRIGICVHERNKGEKPDVFGAKDYNLFVHYWKEMRWRKVERENKPTFEAPGIVEAFNATFDMPNPDGTHTAREFIIDFRPMYSWTEKETVFLSQYGLRHVRWIGDLEAPIESPAPPPVPAAPPVISQQ